MTTPARVFERREVRGAVLRRSLEGFESEEQFQVILDSAVEAFASRSCERERVDFASTAEFRVKAHADQGPLQGVDPNESCLTIHLEGRSNGFRLRVDVTQYVTKSRSERGRTLHFVLEHHIDTLSRGISR